MAFTTEALVKGDPLLSSIRGNREWEVWDEPPPSLPDTVCAFRLFFLTSELAVRPDQRVSRKWKDVLYLQAAPAGKVTVVTLFVTVGDRELRHETEPSIWLASLDIDKRRRAQLVAHFDPESNLPDLIKSGVAELRRQAESNGVSIPSQAYAYLFGRNPDGARFPVGARVNR